MAALHDSRRTDLRGPLPQPLTDGGADRFEVSQLVRDVDIEVPAGEVTVLLGANGVGKSTLLDGVAGVAPVVVDRVLAAVGGLAGGGLAILLVEQFADRALAFGHKAAVLARGGIVLRSPAAEFRRRPDRLQAAYLGGEPDIPGAPDTAPTEGPH